MICDLQPSAASRVSTTSKEICGAPRVSVIIPFHNSESFLQEAIDSVIAQTFSDWELLLVDDGSTDLGTDIGRRAAAHAPDRICMLVHPGRENRGAAASRNLALRHARGELIACLDADDVWLPHKLARQVAALDRHPEVGLIYGASEWWHSWADPAASRPDDHVPDLRVAPNVAHAPPSLLPEFLTNESITPCPSSTLVRRVVIERVGGFEERFCGSVAMYEDQAFYAKVALAFPILRMDICIARYRQHPASVCATGAYGYTAARRFYLEWLRARVAAMATGNDEVRRVLEEQYRVLVPRTRDTLRRVASRLVRAVGRLVVPRQLRPWLRHARVLSFHASRALLLRHVQMVRLRRLEPMYKGRAVGTSVVRSYWADYLERHRADVHGHGLEVGTTATIRQYGGDRLTRGDAIDLTRHSPEVTLVADLSRADALAGERYDCFVVQFTMHVIADINAALYHAIRLLKPGGVLLVNFSCVDVQFPNGLDMGTGRPLFVHWCFTPLQVHNLLRQLGITAQHYELEVYGNLFARIAYELNVPAEALTHHELTHRDPAHPVLVCARVVRPAEWAIERPTYRNAWVPDAVPEPHRA